MALRNLHLIHISQLGLLTSWQWLEYGNPYGNIGNCCVVSYQYA